MAGIRSLTRTVARALVCAFVAGLSLPALSAHGGDRDAITCVENGITAVRGDAAIEGPQTGAEPGHCLLCHWTRAVGNATPVPAVSASRVAGPVEVATALHDGVASSRAATGRASRAPPAAR